MKKLILLLLICSFSQSLLAQSPERFPYQAVFRNDSGELLKNTDISLRFIIRQTALSGTVVYEETWTTTTSNTGVAKVEIGGGTATLGSLGAIDWSAGSHFLDIAYDPAGGTNFTELGVTQLISVPYTLHADKAEKANAKSKSERDGIAVPQTGQLVFCTDCGDAGELQVYNGSRWTNMIGGDPAE